MYNRNTVMQHFIQVWYVIYQLFDKIVNSLANCELKDTYFHIKGEIKAGKSNA